MQSAIALMSLEADSFARVHVVVDALEKCLTSHKDRDPRATFLGELNNLKKLNPKFRILVTSDFHADIQAFFKAEQIHITTTSIKGDVKRYIGMRLKKSSSGEEAWDEFAEAVIEKSDGS